MSLRRFTRRRFEGNPTITICDEFSGSASSMGRIEESRVGMVVNKRSDYSRTEGRTRFGDVFLSNSW